MSATARIFFQRIWLVLLSIYTKRIAIHSQIIHEIYQLIAINPNSTDIRHTKAIPYDCCFQSHDREIFSIFGRIYCLLDNPSFRLLLIILCHISISVTYLPASRSGLSWFSIISRQRISLYCISIHFPVMMRIFFSSVEIRSRIPLLRCFCPIPFF